MAHHQIALAAVVTVCLAVPASGMTFDNINEFETVVGAENLTTFDFDGLVTSPETSVVVTDVDGVSFTTSGSDVIIVTIDGVIQNGEQDRDMRIRFPEPVTAVSVDMVFLDFFNDATIGGSVRGEDDLGNDVFNESKSAGSFFFGHFDPGQPITALILEPDAGGRSVVDTLQFATVPEPSGALIIALAFAVLVVARQPQVVVNR